MSDDHDGVSVGYAGNAGAQVSAEQTTVHAEDSVTRPRPMLAEILRARIRAERIARGWSQADLAAHLDVTQTTISYWETGARDPGLDDVDHLARAFEVEPTRLLDARAERLAHWHALHVRELQSVVTHAGGVITALSQRKDRPDYEPPTDRNDPVPQALKQIRKSLDVLCDLRAKIEGLP